MGRLVDQVRTLAHGYRSKGGKRNRVQQTARMTAFAAFCEAQGCSEMGQVGARHVMNYWRAHRHLAPSTLYNHHLALQTLWRLSGKNGLPPSPTATGSEMTTRQARSTAKPNGAVDESRMASRLAPRSSSVNHVCDFNHERD